MSTSLDWHALNANYKVILVLTAYARLLNLTHDTLVRGLGISGNSLTSYERGMAYAPDNFLRRYASYIAFYLSYDEDKFRQALYSRAAKINLSSSSNKNIHCYWIMVDIANELREND